MRFLLFALLAPVLCLPGCMSGADWLRVGQEVGKFAVASLATNNEQMRDIMHRNNISIADLNNTMDASFDAMRGDWDKVAENGFAVLERKIPGTPTGPPIPTDSTPLYLLGVTIAGIVANEGRKAMGLRRPPKTA